MKKVYFLVAILSMASCIYAQDKPEKESLKYNLNEDGSHYIQATMLNQVWLRYNESNPGTTVEGVSSSNTTDIGLRRTRFQFFGQLTDKVFVYFQFGQNNFNSQYNANASGTGNRKIAPFFHDALCEYKVSHGNQLKLGGGLTIANGLSRFSQPSIGTIMTMDVPVFAQSTVDQIDQFSRKLSVFARGQIGKIDYRLVLSDPFPITSTGTPPPAISTVSNYAQKGHHLQQQAYLMYQFFEHEANTTPYMVGTYLGKKKVFNVALGGIFQKNAMWKLGNSGEEVYQDMKHIAVESFLDMPLNTEKKTAISAYIGYYKMDYGTNYLRYNGIMNPANGTTLTAANSIVGQGTTYGNAFPMFGTGNMVYAQFGYLFKENFLKSKGRFMPYASAILAKYDYLGSLSTNTYNVGLNYFINGHKSKVTLDLQNRPTYSIDNGNLVKGNRLNSIVLQYQINF